MEGNDSQWKAMEEMALMHCTSSCSSDKMETSFQETARDRPSEYPTSLVSSLRPILYAFRLFGIYLATKSFLLVNQVVLMLLCSHLASVEAAGDLQEDLIRAGAAVTAPEGAAEGGRRRKRKRRSRGRKKRRE